MATQVIFAVTDRRIVLFKRSAFGKPKEVLAALERRHVTAVELGTSTLLGQTMPEIQLALASGAEAGFGVAKIDRRDGEAVVAALDLGSTLNAWPAIGSSPMTPEEFRVAAHELIDWLVDRRVADRGAPRAPAGRAR